MSPLFPATIYHLFRCILQCYQLFVIILSKKHFVIIIYIYYFVIVFVHYLTLSSFFIFINIFNNSFFTSINLIDN